LLDTRLLPSDDVRGTLGFALAPSTEALRRTRSTALGACSPPRERPKDGSSAVLPRWNELNVMSRASSSHHVRHDRSPPRPKDLASSPTAGAGGRAPRRSGATRGGAGGDPRIRRLQHEVDELRRLNVALRSELPGGSGGGDGGGIPGAGAPAGRDPRETPPRSEEGTASSEAPPPLAAAQGRASAAAAAAARSPRCSGSASPLRTPSMRAVPVQAGKLPAEDGDDPGVSWIRCVPAAIPVGRLRSEGFGLGDVLLPDRPLIRQFHAERKIDPRDGPLAWASVAQAEVQLETARSRIRLFPARAKNDESLTWPGACWVKGDPRSRYRRRQYDENHTNRPSDALRTPRSRSLSTQSSQKGSFGEERRPSREVCAALPPRAAAAPESEPGASAGDGDAGHPPPLRLPSARLALPAPFTKQKRA